MITDSYVALKNIYKVLNARLKNYQNRRKPRYSDLISYVEQKSNDYPRTTRSYLENIDLQIITNPIISAIIVMFLVVYFIILWKFVEVIKKQMNMNKALMELQKQQYETQEISEEASRDTIDADKHKLRRKRNKKGYYYINKF